MARLTPEELADRTGYERPSAQVRWFKMHFGVDLQHDKKGAIITWAAFDALSMKQCGFLVARDGLEGFE